MTSQDLLHQIHSHRAEVEPFKPLTSDALQAIHGIEGEQSPPSIELISSQSECRPAAGFEGECRKALEDACPELGQLAAFNKGAKDNAPLQQAFQHFKQLTLKDVLAAYAASENKDQDADGAIALYYQRRKEVSEAVRTVLGDEPPIAEDFVPAELMKRINEVVRQKGVEILPKGLLGQIVQLEGFETELKMELREYLYPEEAALLLEHLQTSQQLEQAVHQKAFSPLSFEPPELLEASKTYLRDTHGITAIEEGHTGLYNGGSYVTLLGCIAAVSKPKQMVLTPELHWDGYDAVAQQAGCSLLEIPRGKDVEAFLLEKFDAKTHDKWVKQVKKNVGCILLTHPCSITGKTYTDEELGNYLRLSKKYQIPLVVNEVYASPDHTGKPYNSITQHPEFKGAEQLVYISASLSKTFQQLHLDGTKLAMCWTQNKKWAEVAKAFFVAHQRPFTQHDIAFDLGAFRGTPPDYFVANEQKYEVARQHIDTLIKQQNETAGKTLLSWSAEGYPTSGYMAAMHLNAESVAKAGISNVLDLWEYVYKVAGVNAGPVFFAADTGKDDPHPPMALRINYSVPLDQLTKGIQAMALAVKAMDQGITFEQIKAMQGEPRPEYAQELLLQKMMAEYGGGQTVDGPNIGVKQRG